MKVMIENQPHPGPSSMLPPLWGAYLHVREYLSYAEAEALENDVHAVASETGFTWRRASFEHAKRLGLSTCPDGPADVSTVKLYLATLR